MNESEQGGQKDAASSGGHRAVASGQPQRVAATRRQSSAAGRHCSRLETSIQLQFVPTDSALSLNHNFQTVKI